MVGRSIPPEYISLLCFILHLLKPAVSVKVRQLFCQCHFTEQSWHFPCALSSFEWHCISADNAYLSGPERRVIEVWNLGAGSVRSKSPKQSEHWKPNSAKRIRTVWTESHVVCLYIYHLYVNSCYGRFLFAHAINFQVESCGDQRPPQLLQLSVGELGRVGSERDELGRIGSERNESRRVGGKEMSWEGFNRKETSCEGLDGKVETVGLERDELRRIGWERDELEELAGKRWVEEVGLERDGLRRTGWEKDGLGRIGLEKKMNWEDLDWIKMGWEGLGRKKIK